MNSKRIFAGILSVAMLASMMAVQAFAAELTAMQAKTIAQKYLPKDSIHLHTKDEGYKYDRSCGNLKVSWFMITAAKR